MLPLIPAIPAILTTGRSLFFAGTVVAAALTQTKKGKEITSSIKDVFSNSMKRLNNDQSKTKQMVKDIKEGRMK